MKPYKKLIATQRSRDFREAVEVVEQAWHAPGPGEVVVRNRYCGINASDINYTAGRYDPKARPPLDTGFEAVGEVVVVGENVQQPQVGDYVVAMGMGTGFREYAVHSAKRVFPVDVTEPEYLSMILSGLTAAFGLYITGEMASDETVMVTAAAGGTGQYAVQLAKIEGNRVIGTCGSEEKAALLKELGVDRIINYRQENVKQVLKSEYPQGVDLVYECVGGEMFDTCVKALAIRGRLVVIGYISEYNQDQPEVITQPRIYSRLLWKSASIRGMFLNHYLRHAPEYLPRLMNYYQTGKLKIKIDETPFNGLEAVADAVEYLHSGQSKGKVVVKLA